MNTGAADMGSLNGRGMYSTDSRVRTQHRVDSQRQTHDQSRDNSQSHDSSRIQVPPLCFDPGPTWFVVGRLSHRADKWLRFDRSRRDSIAMNRGTADLSRSNLHRLNNGGVLARVEHGVDSQCQTHDESGDDSQSHDSSRIKLLPL